MASPNGLDAVSSPPDPVPVPIPVDEPAIFISNLTFQHNPGDPTSAPTSPPSLVDVNLCLPRGSRTLLIGANGAGKSTLLQLLAGKRLLPKESTVHVLGSDVFARTSPRITFLGTEWASSPAVRRDLPVSTFLDSIGGYRHASRRDALLDLLDVDLAWRMHAISDGERRRVQLVMGLMHPWDVLLLDEVTVDLDVLVRADLLAFLKGESERRGATVLYATHIFDGLAAFPTHIAHMRLGTFVAPPSPWPLPSLPPSTLSASTSPTPTPTLTPQLQAQLQAQSQSPADAESSLHAVALRWLKEDRMHRRALEAAGVAGVAAGAAGAAKGAGVWRARGARRGEDAMLVTDSETFFRKYDYSHD